MPLVQRRRGSPGQVQKPGGPRHHRQDSLGHGGRRPLVRSPEGTRELRDRDGSKLARGFGLQSFHDLPQPGLQQSLVQIVHPLEEHVPQRGPRNCKRANLGPPMGAWGGAHGQNHLDALDSSRHIPDAVRSAHSEPPSQEVKLKPHNGGHHLRTPLRGECIDTFQDAHCHLHSIRNTPAPAGGPQQVLRRLGKAAQRGLREVRRVRRNPRGAGDGLLLQREQHFVHQDGLGRIVDLQEGPQRLAGSAPHRRILVQQIAANQRCQLPSTSLELESGHSLPEPIVEDDSSLPIVPDSRKLSVPRLRVDVLGACHSRGATCKLGLQQHCHFWPPTTLDQIRTNPQGLLQQLGTPHLLGGFDGVNRGHQNRAKLQQETRDLINDFGPQLIRHQTDPHAIGALVGEHRSASAHQALAERKGSVHHTVRAAAGAVVTDSQAILYQLPNHLHLGFGRGVQGHGAGLRAQERTAHSGPPLESLSDTPVPDIITGVGHSQPHQYPSHQLGASSSHWFALITEGRLHKCHQLLRPSSNLRLAIANRSAKHRNVPQNLGLTDRSQTVGSGWQFRQLHIRNLTRNGWACEREASNEATDRLGGLRNQGIR
mmetsp:Transcript_57993/g.124773  ORF Transcript_57993/g.124773 Transcript_57993/m.124773 type:complete len:598 (-) Transcript_57993:424-2217(-)